LAAACISGAEPLIAYQPGVVRLVGNEAFYRAAP
jgi:hypothetical protein